MNLNLPSGNFPRELLSSTHKKITDFGLLELVADVFLQHINRVFPQFFRAALS